MRPVQESGVNQPLKLFDYRKSPLPGKRLEKALAFNTRAAVPGQILELYGVGIGPTNPPVTAGHAYTGAAGTTNRSSTGVSVTLTVTAGTSDVLKPVAANVTR